MIRGRYGWSHYHYSGQSEFAVGTSPTDHEKREIEPQNAFYRLKGCMTCKAVCILLISRYGKLINETCLGIQVIAHEAYSPSGVSCVPSICSNPTIKPHIGTTDPIYSFPSFLLQSDR